MVQLGLVQGSVQLTKLILVLRISSGLGSARSIPSDRDIPGNWQNLEAKVVRAYIAGHGPSLSLISTGCGRPGSRLGAWLRDLRSAWIRAQFDSSRFGVLF